MTKKELKIEIEEITRIFQSAKYNFEDFKYLHSVKTNKPIVYKTYYFFIERIFHSICVSLILNLCILFDKKEKDKNKHSLEEYSFEKLLNKMQEDYSKSELNNSLSKFHFEEMCSVLDSERIGSLRHKLKTTRDQYYAHFDRTRTDFETIIMNSSEFDELISTAETFLKEIKLKYFDVSVDFNLPTTELGHKLFERLDEWEQYREKYGILKDNENPEDQDSKPLTPGAKFLKELREMPYDNSMVGKAFVMSLNRPTKGMKNFFDRKNDEKEKNTDKEKP